jgi:uncharacterized phage-associated protein
MTNTTLGVMDVANYVIYLASQSIVGDEGEREGITNLKLQKILYFIEAYSLVVKGQSMFSDSIQAWEYGPVIPTAYHSFKQNKSDPIFPEEGYVVLLDEERRKVIEDVWNTFNKFSASRLVEITHRHTPWKEAFKLTQKGLDGEISREEIAKYYSGLFE